MLVRRALLALAVSLGLLTPSRVLAQPTQKLFSQSASGTITANGGSVEMSNAGGLGTLRIQTTATSYSGTWEVQCSAAPTGTTPVYDTDDEVNLSLEGASASAVQAVTDTQGIWTASIAGCTSVKVITTAWTSGTLTVYMYATTTGGGSASGGGGGGGEVTNAGTFAVQCTSGCGGSGGVSAADDADFTDGTSDGTPIGGVAESAAPTTVTEGDFGWAAITLNRALKTALYNPSGTSAFGTAGTAATPVLTVQGIASMTALTVSATDLDIQSGGADVLSTTAFNASLGTAGSADSQVQSIQGIASMTPVQVTNPTAASASSYITARLSDGSNFLTASTDMTIGSAFGTTGPGNVASYKDFDGSALPTTANVGTEEEATPLAASIVGVQYTMPVTENGAATAIGVDDAAASTAGAAFVIGAKADEASTDSVDEDDIGYIRMSLDRLLYTRQLDPCSGVAKQYLPIDIVTATTTEITASLAGASTHYYICSVALVSAGANNVAIVDDDSDNCGSVTSGVMGGTTAGEGFNLAANGGLTLGNGMGSIARTNGTNRVLCIVTSAAVQLSGTITVVAAP